MQQQNLPVNNLSNTNENDAIMTNNNNSLLNITPTHNPLKYSPMDKQFTQLLDQNASNNSNEAFPNIYLSPNYGLIVKVNQPITPYIQRTGTAINHKHEFISHIRNKLICYNKDFTSMLNKIKDIKMISYAYGSRSNNGYKLELIYNDNDWQSALNLAKQIIDFNIFTNNNMISCEPYRPPLITGEIRNIPFTHNIETIMNHIKQCNIDTNDIKLELQLINNDTSKVKFSCLKNKISTLTQITQLQYDTEYVP